MNRTIFFLFSILAFLASCSSGPKYEIGVSQCSEDDWRALLNLEIQREARFQGDMNVEVLSANDDSQQQIRDIEEFINEGKDLIIVAPNVAEDVRPAIEKAYDKGIPVILVDRRTTGEKYTAFIGANNRRIGEQIADFLNAKTEGRPAKVVELRGLRGSSPEAGRHEGFRARINNKVEIVADVFADWNEAQANRAMDSLLRTNLQIDYVYAHNDRMAKGAYDAIKNVGRENKIGIIGVDALLFDGGGVDMVLEGRLLASHLYPTGGSEAIELAGKILRGEPFDREIELPAALVDEVNARVLKLEYKTLSQLDAKYLKLEKVTDHQLEQINKQYWMLGGTIAIMILLALLLLSQYKVHKEKKQADEMLMQALQSTAPSLNHPSPPLLTEGGSENDTLVGDKTINNSPSPCGESRGGVLSEGTTPFLASVQSVIIAHIGDSDFSVNDIASELGMSRVQLYRKIKSMSDQNVSDLIKKARLDKARELLSTTHKTISEVAYAVGFSSPSYFTKCFKEYFGEAPSDVQNA